MFGACPNFESCNLASGTKLVQCSTCKQRFGQFGFFSARQRPKNGLTRFERHFLAKCPGVNGLSQKFWMMNQPQPCLPRRDQNGDQCQRRQRNCDGWKARFVSARFTEGIASQQGKLTYCLVPEGTLQKMKTFPKHVHSFVEKIDHHGLANAPLLSE